MDAATVKFILWEIRNRLLSAQIRNATFDALETSSRNIQSQIEIAEEEWQRSMLKKDQEAELRRIERVRLERERREEEARIQREREAREAREEAQRKAARLEEAQQGRVTVRLNSRRCPGCKKRVQKNGGCDHIHCICGADWDYVTGRLWQL
ncbi:hypothetical protein VPNG_01438 [Cytospora leucostoma]|uniref:IBR domain-containing protein n=1 Tax=Cytospora leucostoma TaxID=1230097 RepID=A0A423XL59_9PEZI|nr:hypothetical protein VPNG_01438 [Cytospora leucostoma]